MTNEHSAAPPRSSTFRERTGFQFGPALLLTILYWWVLILLDTAVDGFNIRYNRWSVQPAELWVNRSVWFGSWILVSPLILVVLGRAYPGRHAWPRTLAANVTLHPAIMALQVLLATITFKFLDPGPVVNVVGDAVRLFLTISLGRDIVAYAALVGIFYALSLWKRRYMAEIRAARLAAESAELSRRLSESKLESLRREMNPHLLFNALNSIGTLVRGRENAKAVRMLSSMSTLLRAYLRPSSAELVPLADELDLLDRYLDVERVRLEERLQVRVTVDPAALDASVPPLLLQPIVENAIKHGADRSAGVTLLSIDVSAPGAQLSVVVSNESEPWPEPRLVVENEDGIGLTNLRHRLELLFGDTAGVELSPRPGGASVRVWMPGTEAGPEVTESTLSAKPESA